MLNDGDQIPGNVSISQNSNDLTTSSQLTVMGLASEDAGVYTCVAINDLGNDSRAFEVNAIGEQYSISNLHMYLVIGLILQGLTLCYLQ